MGTILSMSGYDIASIIIGIVVFLLLVFWVVGFVLAKKKVIKGKFAKIFLGDDKETEEVEYKKED